MDRNIEHFNERLDKETYTKDEVAGLLHNESQFTARISTKNMVSRDDFDSLQSQFNEASESLGKYQDNEFKAKIADEFKTLNGNVDRVDDLVKLTGINKDMSAEDITNSITSFKDKEEYGFLFNSSNSGGITKTPEVLDTPKNTNIRDFAPSQNGGFLNNIFKNKNKD